MHQSDQAIIFFQKREMRRHEITFNTNPSEAPRARADFTYKITPTMISITGTGLGSCPVIEEIEAVLRKIEYWHRGSIVKFKIMCRDGKGFWPSSMGRQNSVLVRPGGNRRATSLQEVVYQRELIGREVRPIQKRKLCSLHDGSIVDLARNPGEYRDRCVGDRVHK